MTFYGKIMFLFLCTGGVFARLRQTLREESHLVWLTWPEDNILGVKFNMNLMQMVLAACSILLEKHCL